MCISSFQKHMFLLRRKEIYKQSSCVSRTYTTIPNEFLIREIHPASNPRQFLLIRLTFCKANIVDTNRYSLENVLLSFFRPFSSVGPSSLFFSFLLSLFLSISLSFRLAPSISSPTLPTLRHTTASVSTDTRGTSKSFVLPPRCLPFPSPCPSVPLYRSLLSSFFRVQIELYERVSRESSPRDREGGK